MLGGAEWAIRWCFLSVPATHLPAARHLSFVGTNPEDGGLRRVVREVPREGVEKDEHRDEADARLEEIPTKG